MSLLPSAAWALADASDGAHHSSWFAVYWNKCIHVPSFVINAVAFARIKVELDERRHLAAELETVRDTLRAVAGRLPTCPKCGQIHKPEVQPCKEWQDALATC
jgi:hypothetical protein